MRAVRKFFRNYQCYCFIIIAIAFFIFMPRVSEASVLSGYDYPRIANIFLKTPLTNEEAESLSKWDIVVLGMQAQDTSHGQIRRIRELNPDVKILAYVASQEFPETRYGEIESADGPWHKLRENISDEWWLYTSGGEHFSSWPGNWSLNVTNKSAKVNGKRWNTYLPEIMHEHVMSTGLWDGIFYDNVWPNVSWVGNGDMDINRDGIKDSTTYLDNAWQEGMTTMLEYSRQLEGENKLIIGNGGDVYKEYLNGRHYENFPSEWEGGWAGATDLYFDFIENGYAPTICIINGVPVNYSEYDYQSLRYYLTSTLLSDGFMSFDKSPSDHTQLWWYDEYDLSLGDPTTRAYNTLNQGNPYTVQDGVWRRDFEKGIVLLNTTSTKRTVKLGGPYEKITGTQDTAINNGDIITSVDLSTDDGIILLKRLSDVRGVTFQNGGYAKVFSDQGVESRNSFYSYDSNYPGGTQIVHYDIDSNGREETVMADDTRVWVYNYKNELMYNFCPYNCSYSSGINLAVGDMNKDGKAEIVTGTKLGGGPHVRVFSYTGRLVRPGFFAFAKNFRGGSQIALADLDGDGLYEIVVGAGYSGGPHVRIFDRFGNLINIGFFAYDSKFRGGVNIAVGDLNNDGKYEIVTGAGPGGGPHVRIFNKNGKLLSSGFFAYDQSYRGGVRVQVVDIDGNGTKEILTMTQ